MGKPKPPESPDYAGAAQAQGAANIDAARTTAKLSNPNIISPYGTQWVSYDGDQPTITQSLTPTAQQSLNEQEFAQYRLSQTANEQANAIRNLLNTPFSFQGSPQSTLDESGVAKAPINAGTTAQQAILARLNPELQRRRTSVETQLANQGLVAGDEAYNNAIKLLGETENDALSQAALQGVNADMAANQQGFGQALQRGQFGNTAMQQNLALQSQLRDQPLNEIAALLSGGQVNNPQFAPYQGSTVNAAPLFAATQAQGAFDQNAYNQQVAQRNALMGGLFGLGSAGITGLFGLGR